MRTHQAATRSPMHPACPLMKLKKVMPTGCLILENLPVTRTQYPEPRLWAKLHNSLAWLCEPENLPPPGNFMCRPIPRPLWLSSQPHLFLLLCCFSNRRLYDVETSPFPYFKSLGCKERKTGSMCHSNIFPDGKPVCNTGKCPTEPWLTHSPHFTENSQI